MTLSYPTTVPQTPLHSVIVDVRIDDRMSCSLCTNAGCTNDEFPVHFEDRGFVWPY